MFSYSARQEFLNARQWMIETAATAPTLREKGLGTSPFLPRLTTGCRGFLAHIALKAKPLTLAAVYADGGRTRTARFMSGTIGTGGWKFTTREGDILGNATRTRGAS